MLSCIESSLGTIIWTIAISPAPETVQDLVMPCFLCLIGLGTSGKPIVPDAGKSACSLIGAVIPCFEGTEPEEDRESFLKVSIYDGVFLEPTIVL